MTHERFEQLLDELDGDSLTTLKAKNKMYSRDNDALHNFKSGANISGGTPAQACWGYLVKHLVALRDKIQNDDFVDRTDLKEKCQDSINYIRFIWALAHEDEKTICAEANAIESIDDICYACSEHCHISARDCDCCKWIEICDYDRDTLEITNRPCKSCKYSLVPTDPQYNTAPLNWEVAEGLE